MDKREVYNMRILFNEVPVAPRKVTYGKLLEIATRHNMSEKEFKFALMDMATYRRVSADHEGVWLELGD